MTEYVLCEAGLRSKEDLTIKQYSITQPDGSIAIEDPAAWLGV
jgi:hypothetical protein